MFAKLDIRTLSFMVLFFGYFYGLGLLLYARTQEKFHGITRIGISYFIGSTGFLFLSLRGIITPFFTIIVANFLIFGSTVLLYEGLVQFRRVKSWTQFVGPGLLILLVIGFLHYTYNTPNINARIAIISGFMAIEYTLMAFLLLYHTPKVTHTADRLTGISFILYALFYIFRTFWTVQESPLQNFMEAGVVHAVSLIIFILFMLSTSFGVIWIASAIMQNEMKAQAQVDPLTAIYNRRVLKEIAQRELARVHRHRVPLSVIMIDVDHFKLVNDTYGHHIGDLVLKHIVFILKESIRINDTIARYGGEEFVILLPDTESQSAYVVAEKLRQKVEATPLKVGEEEIWVTASFGYTTTTGEKSEWDELVDVADKALYNAKEEGRNRIWKSCMVCTKEECSEQCIEAPATSNSLNG